MAQPSSLSRPPLLLLVAGLTLGAIVRVWLLPVPGTPDVGSWKIWAVEGASDPTGHYGVGGSPPERRLLEWNGMRGTTEYPPAALYQMSAVGWLYGRINPAFADSPTFTALIKLPGLLAEIAFVIAMLAWRRHLGPAAVWMALAFWLNPAIVLNGAALGYLDAQMAVPAALALVAAAIGQAWLAGGLLALGILTKAQAVFLAPVVALAVLRARPQQAVRSLAGAAVGGLVVSAVLVGPILLRGAGPNMLQALGRLGAHDMLSGYALNFWWIVTWIVRSLHALELGTFTAFTLPVRILGISRFMEVGYPDPKPIAAAVVCAAILWATWRVRAAISLIVFALAGAWGVYFYAMFNTQVHENHAYLVVPVLAVAAGLAPALRPLFWWISVLTALNMYLFYGLGADWSPMIDRRLTIVDLSVILSAVNLVVLVPLTSELLMRTRKPQAIAGAQY